MQVRMLLCVLGVLGIASAANAQSDPQSDGCKATPEQSPGGNKPAPNPNGTSETMQKCGGVLKPPETGDKEMAVPVPDQGKTPVIKPQQIPQQQPK